MVENVHDDSDNLIVLLNICCPATFNSFNLATNVIVYYLQYILHDILSSFRISREHMHYKPKDELNCVL